MAKATKKTVKMFGTGNFQVGETLYVFRNGEEVEVKDQEHLPFLEAEAKRRENNQKRLDAMEEKRKQDVEFFNK